MGSKYVKYPASLTLVSAFWSLLFAKCFGLEYLVRIYNVPVNTLFYVWSLSIGMAATATLLYFKQQDTKKDKQIGKTVILLSVVASLLATLGLSSPGSIPFARHLALVLFAVITASLYLLQGRQSTVPFKSFSSAGWLIGALLLCFIQMPQSLLVISLLFLVCSAIPAFAGYFQKRKEIELALRALHES